MLSQQAFRQSNEVFEISMSLCDVSWWYMSAHAFHMPSQPPQLLHALCRRWLSAACLCNICAFVQSKVYRHVHCPAYTRCPARQHHQCAVGVFPTFPHGLSICSQTSACRSQSLQSRSRDCWLNSVYACNCHNKLNESCIFVFKFIITQQSQFTAVSWTRFVHSTTLQNVKKRLGFKFRFLSAQNFHGECITWLDDCSIFWRTCKISAHTWTKP